MNEVVNNVGLNSFITRVYKTTGVALMGTFAASQWALSTGIYMAPYANIAAIVAMLGGFIGSSYMTPNMFTYEKNGHTHIKSTNSPLRVGLYGLGCVGMGVMSAPLFAAVSHINPMIVPTAVVLSTGVFGAASAYAYSRPSGSLLSWGSSLYAGLIGMIGMNIIGLITSWAIGPNMFSFMCHRADTYIGLGLFTAMVAYDTHVAI